MKKSAIFLVLVLLYYVSNSQISGYTTLKDIQSFKSKFALASQKLQSIECDFNQVKTISMLKDKLKSSGKFWYKTPNKVRLDYQKPYKYIMVLNGSSVMVQDEQKTSTYNARSNKLMQSVNNIMLDCMRGTVYNNKDFITQVFESDREYLLRLTPSTTSIKRMFSHIDVILDKQNLEVARLHMIEQGGDNTVMTFSNRVQNKNIDENIFKTK